MDEDVEVISDDEETVSQKSILNDIESPINLNISTMKIINLNPLTWNNYNVIPEKVKIMNTGKTVLVNGKWKKEPFLTGGPLYNDYIFSQFHFHWGPNEMVGSEHSVDNERYPMELHAVHFSSIFNSYKIAQEYDDGIMIVVYLFKLQSFANEVFNNILQSLPFIKKSNTSTRIISEPINNILRPFSQDYFYYIGILTESHARYKVLWLINRQPIGIAIQQLSF